MFAVICATSWFLFSQTILLAETVFDLPVAKENQPRIISLGGDITEIIYALHAEQQLVGADTTSQWPVATQALPKVGYFRALSAEGLLSLAPNLIIMSEAAGPTSVIEQIQAVGVATIRTSSDKTPAGVLNKVRHVAQALSLHEAGEQLTQDIQTDFDLLNNLKEQWQNHPRVTFIFSVSKGAAMASGQNTAADAMIKLAGGINVFTEYRGYKPVNSEALIAAAPEFILLTENTLKPMGGLDKIMNLPGMSLTPAAINKQIIVMDTLYLLGFGPRTGQAAVDLSRYLHPELTAKHNNTLESTPVLKKLSEHH